MRIKYSAEVLKIIEAGVEGDVEKVKAYATLLADKMPEGDLMRRAIKKRVDGTYKNDLPLKALYKNKYKE